MAAGYTDMRSLALTVQEIVKRDPHAGDLYIFRERRGDLVKILGMTRQARYRAQRRSPAIRELATSRTRLYGSLTRL
ncbi:IS66 family insertion sequence element accessory protein TnpB [Bradyrhizobium sp. I1.7.5]|uniref:IS66 family insertion sequence element accessory protein TnpB n=1 Tax=Bradyrhizobium sp. I1.7.5 TaxID=3156363 RepID=UPI0033999649